MMAQWRERSSLTNVARADAICGLRWVLAMLHGVFSGFSAVFLPPQKPLLQIPI